MWAACPASLLRNRDFKQNNLTIINFNYDRSLDFYLFNAIKSLMDEKNNDSVRKVFDHIKIYDPYGKIGDSILDMNNCGNTRIITAQILTASITGNV